MSLINHLYLNPDLRLSSILNISPIDLYAFLGKLPSFFGQSSDSIFTSTMGPINQWPLGSRQLSAWACSRFSLVCVGLFQESTTHQPTLDLSGTLLPWKHEARRPRSQVGPSYREVVPGDPFFKVGRAASLGLLPEQSSGSPFSFHVATAPPPPNLMLMRNLGM